MRGTEVREMLELRAQPEHRFVRWWRRENDFLDYDLVERFRSNLGDAEEIGGMELLTTDEMWAELKRIAAERVRHDSGRRDDVIEWVHEEAGVRRTDVYPYTPETILAIFDAETRDNPLC